MYIGKTSGKRYPKEIYNRLDESEKAEFVEVSDTEYEKIVEEANETNCIIGVSDEGVMTLTPRVVNESDELLFEKVSLKSYLTSTDWVVAKCYELELKVSDTYPDIYQKRGEARTRINEIDSLLG